MINFNTLLVSGIPLLVIIFGLVEFSKKIGLKGNGLTIFSLILGVAFGVAYQVAASGVPTGFAGWFTVTVFGLALGLTTCGLYDFADKRFPQQP